MKLTQLHVNDSKSKVYALKHVQGLFHSVNRYFKNRDYSKFGVRNKTGNYSSCLKGKGFSDKVQNSEYPYIEASFSIKCEPVSTWISPEAIRVCCDRKIQIFDDHFGLLHDVILDPTKLVDAGIKPKGGESLQNVLGQKEEDEFFEYTSGFWKVYSTSDDMSSLSESTFHWLPFIEVESSENSNTKKRSGKIPIETNFTLAVTREDYCNLHNFVRQMYNAFLLMMIFKIQPTELSVLFLDAHPTCILDSTWEDIFGNVTRVGKLNGPVLYKNLIWGFKESDCELTKFESDHLAYGEEFRSYYLKQHNVKDVSALDCNRIKITVILRHDKVFHPRNEEGILGRKIYNEAEIISTLTKTFPEAYLQAVVMESLSMRGQLDIIGTTDILIGMHGAGMTHTLFLPKHAAVLELFPYDFKTDRPWYLCYQKIAEWRGLKYQSWENFDVTYEMPNEYTILPKDIILEKTKYLMEALCNS